MANWSTKETNTALALRIDIHHAENSRIIARPEVITAAIESTSDKFKETNQPLPYYTDALVGLSTFKLLLHSRESLSSNEEALSALLWQRLEPMHEIYHRSFQRIKPLLNLGAPKHTAEGTFEKSLKDIVRAACHENGTQLTEILNLIDSINFLETKRSRPLLFDTKIHLSSAALSILHTLYSLLYNLRAYTASQYNSKRNDNLFDALHIDSVKDYFQAPDLLTNDSLLYHHFLNLRKNGIFTELGEESMTRAFKNFLPHSHYLVHALPEEFFSQQSPENLEQSLYMFQIDWLLGSPGGLLYRIREELNGLKEGYEQTFWSELMNTENETHIETFHIDCVLGSEHIRQLSDAA